jgi:hypothetical protein
MQRRLTGHAELLRQSVGESRMPVSLHCMSGSRITFSSGFAAADNATYVDVGASRTTLLGDHRRRSLPPLSTSGPLALAPATSPFCDVVVPAQSAAAFTLRRIHDFRRHTFTQG